ncbi:MAG: hypothetical protein F6K24_24900 [Okeania sp. SIO2D1]|nr:hypothetical protein [Okeania sp. SIO2D1]
MIYCPIVTAVSARYEVHIYAQASAAAIYFYATKPFAYGSLLAGLGVRSQEKWE